MAEKRCNYRDCERKRDRGWTTCAKHHSAGKSVKQEKGKGK